MLSICEERSGSLTNKRVEVKCPDCVLQFESTRFMECGVRPNKARVSEGGVNMSERRDFRDIAFVRLIVFDNSCLRESHK